MTNPYGTLSTQHGKPRVRYERHFPHPVEKVWRALIEPEELKHWFPTTIDGERKAGAKLRFAFEGSSMDTMEGTLTIFDPPRLLEFSWAEDVLRFELTPEANGCKLVFITTIGDRTIAPRTASGWHTCLDNLLNRVSGKDAQPKHTQSWPALYVHYSKEFGPNDFPEFVKAGGIAVSGAMHTRGLDGYGFRGHGELRVELLRASEDAETIEHAAAPHEYVTVLEGRYELQMGGGKLVLEPGLEFQLPPGMEVSGRITRGTRLLRAVSAVSIE